MTEPYTFYNIEEPVGFTPCHYFKHTSDDGRSLEGVLAIDLNSDILSDELSQLTMQYDKFYLASAQLQNIVASSTNSGNILQDYKTIINVS